MQQSDMAKLYRELRFTRIVGMVSSFLAVLLLIGGGYLLNTVKDVTREVQPVVDIISAVDVESFNNTLEQVNIVIETVDWEKLSQSLGELDVEALNKAIADLDTAELSEALANLNAAVEMLRSISQSLNPLNLFQ